MPDEPIAKTQRQAIGRGQQLEELIKGSLDYTLHLIREAFYRQFRRADNDWFYLREVFTDYVIVEHENLPPDEFYQVTYTAEGERFTFAPRDQWELVELSYQPKALTESKLKNNRFNL